MSKRFVEVENNGDVTTLLKEIRTISLQIETNTSVYDALDEANALYYSYRKEANESNAKHLRKFKSIVSAVEYLGGSMFSDKTLTKAEKAKDEEEGATEKSDDAYKIIVKDKMLGVAFIKRADKERYGKLMKSIRDNHAFKKDVYPVTLHDAYELLENHSSANGGRHIRAKKTRDTGG